MSWSDVGEIIKAIAPVFTAGAACAAAVIGWRGLEKWRVEALGKRRAEIAETTLAHVYEMAEVLQSARAPFVSVHELGKKDGVPDHVAADAKYAPEARLLEHKEFFGQFRAQRFAFAAVFGRDAMKPLEELWRIRLEINSAVFDLMNNKDLAQGRTEDRKIWREWYDTAFRSPKIENDALAKRISAQVLAIEETCRPAIEARAK